MRRVSEPSNKVVTRRDERFLRKLPFCERQNSNIINKYTILDVFSVAQTTVLFGPALTRTSKFHLGLYSAQKTRIETKFFDNAILIVDSTAFPALKYSCTQNSMCPGPLQTDHVEAGREKIGINMKIELYGLVSLEL